FNIIALSLRGRFLGQGLMAPL
ncbi:MAG: hypothetical protein JWO26_3530, partial [Rhodospirillales bacterium]|nr:hypothetical protein [Rhodospirillales bacterium]